MSGNNQSVEARGESDVVRDGGSGAGVVEMDHSGVGGGAGGNGTRAGLDGGSVAFGGGSGMEGDSWRDSTGSLSPNGGFGREKEVTAGLSGFGRADGNSILEGEGAWPCSQDIRQDSTLGGTSIGRIGDDISTRQPGNRGPVNFGPGATPPSLAKPLAIHGGTNLMDFEEDSAGFSGSRVIRGGLFQSQQVDPPRGSKAGHRPGGIPGRETEQPTLLETEFLFTSTINTDFEHSNEYAEDGFPGNPDEIPANLALNNPIGMKKDLRRNQLPWAVDGWGLDDTGYLVSTQGERRKLDQYQRNFWKRREKNLRREEERRRKAKAVAMERAAEVVTRMEKRKRESDEASRTLDLHKKGRLEIVDARDQEGLDPEEPGITPSEKSRREYVAKLEKKKEKTDAEKKKRDEESAYWKDPEVEKMTARIVSTIAGRKLGQLDITLISAAHIEQKAEKLIKYGEMAKARRTKPVKIGLGAHGLRIHLAHEDGWEWWKELVEGMDPIEDENGSYSYRLLKPGEEAFKSFFVYVPDIRLMDRSAAPTAFRNELLSIEETWEEFEWECRFVTTRTGGVRPVVVMKMTIPENRAEWLLTHCVDGDGRSCIQYGAERHRLYPDEPFSQRRHRPGAGGGGGAPEGHRPPPSEGGGEDDGEDVVVEVEEDDEETLADGGGNPEELDEKLLDDEDGHDYEQEEAAKETEKEKI